MSETSAFIRYFLTGALALTGLLLPALPADAVASPGRPERTGATPPAGHRTTPASEAAGAMALASALPGALSSVPTGAGPGIAAAHVHVGVPAPAGIPVPEGAPAPAGAPAPTGAGAPGRDGAGHKATGGKATSGKATSSKATGSKATGRDSAAHVFSGQGFDTCEAPDLATMDAWIAHSDYRAVGIYFGGRARACATQTHLTPDWVQHTTGSGWSLLPIYVGSQSPCASGSKKNPYLIDGDQPGTQGASEAADAVQRAQDLGLRPGSALYLDMEAYDIEDAACASTTLAYIQAWDRGVAAAGYLSGFYSSADSGIVHMARARSAGAPDLPDVLWYARWGVPPTLTDEPSLGSDVWTPHARIHQYHGAVTESHGGKELNIDRDLLDAPVAVVG
jgi:hypothetical protein